jgi:uncharacterized membrane protein YeiH
MSLITSLFGSFAVVGVALNVSSSDAILVVSVVGTIAFALSGVEAATEAGMDWLGGVVLAAIAAIGGGTIRDLLIDRQVFWIVDEWPLLVSLATATVAIATLRARPLVKLGRASWFVASDAIGLGAFVVVGTSTALDAGSSNLVAALMGVITGVGGGVLRDVFARRTPIVFVGEIYAVAGLIGAGAHLLLVEVDAVELARNWIPLAVVVAIRGVAVRWSLHLPRLGG